MWKWVLVALAPVFWYISAAFIAAQFNPWQWTEYGRFLYVFFTGVTWSMIAIKDCLDA